MTDEELKAGVQEIQTQLAEIRKKSRSQQLRNILADIDSWTEESAERLIHCDSQRRNAKQAVTKTVKHAVSGTRVSFLPVYQRQKGVCTIKIAGYENINPAVGKQHSYRCMFRN